MSTIKHRFLDHQINSETEILILGTFNPDTEKNEADFFYGRSRNYLWKLLPTAFQKPDLKKSSKQEKIDLIDLIAEIEVKDGQEANYDDTFINSRVIQWQTVINEIEKIASACKIYSEFCANSKRFIANQIPGILVNHLFTIRKDLDYDKFTIWSLDNPNWSEGLIKFAMNLSLLRQEVEKIANILKKESHYGA